MTKSTQTHRKDEHLSLGTNLWRQDQNINVGATFEDVRWIPKTFPEMAVRDVDTKTTLFNHQFMWPFYIEAMTGGSELTGKINGQLASVAKTTNIAMAVGSQSIALKEPDLVESFKIVRKNNPDGFLFANLGADHPIKNVRAAIDMIDANAIELHVNVAQELVMAEGDREFYWLDNIADVIAKSPVPVIIKEVGFGMSQSTIKILNKLQPAAINIGGANGTNFAVIERRRLRHQSTINIDNFGLSTVETLISSHIANNHLPLIATGGIKSVNDVVTSLMLGADLVSSAGYILNKLMSSNQTLLIEELEAWQASLPLLYTLLGAKNKHDLQQTERLYSDNLSNFISQQKKQS